MMKQLMSFLAALSSLYMLILSARIIFSWFGGAVRVPELLSRITDPYLDWFRRFRGLRVGYLDLSPLAGLALLSVLNQIFLTLARFGTISLGIILALILQVLGSILSFFVGFLFILLALRLFAYLSNRDIYRGFWRAVDTAAQPVLFRINRFLFRGRIVNFRDSLILSVVIMAVLYLVLGIAVSLAADILMRLPI